MTRTMTNAAADRAYTALSAATEETKQLGYAIARNKQKFETELKPYLDAKTESIKKHGVDMGDGRVGLRPTDTEAIKAFNEDMADIATAEITVDVFQVDEDVFMGGTLTAAQMAELMFMVKSNGQET